MTTRMQFTVPRRSLAIRNHLNAGVCTPAVHLAFVRRSRFFLRLFRAVSSGYTRFHAAKPAILCEHAAQTRRRKFSPPRFFREQNTNPTENRLFSRPIPRRLFNPVYTGAGRSGPKRNDTRSRVPRTLGLAKSSPATYPAAVPQCMAIARTRSKTCALAGGNCVS